MNSTAAIFRIHSDDNVAVALRDLTAGADYEVDGISINVTSEITAGHKIALARIASGQNVVKFGQPIGHATETINPGDHVHTHNMATNLNKTDCDKRDVEDRLPGSTSPPEKLTFNGYVRPDGQVGIRNEVWIIPTVGCVNRLAETMAFEAQKRLTDDTVNGVFAMTHPLGCSQLGDDHGRTQKILASLVRHPNAAGVLVLGLGCESNNIDAFSKVLGEIENDRVVYLNVQDVEDEMWQASKLLDQLISHAAACRREPVDASTLRVGLKCGGSDGLSGITANPLVGVVTDRIVAAGGSVILTEVPEMFGAEPLLFSRCNSPQVVDQTQTMIDRFKAYFQRYGQPIDKNPSPGNLEGGITTLEEKSLGCVQKAGGAKIVDVLGYGDQATKPGVNLLDGPGNDIVSVTNLAAAGAQMTLFTTGRGTPLGSVVPTVKIATNTPLAQRKPHWIDFDAGALLDGRAMDDLADELLATVLDIASGRVQTANERHGHRDLAIFTDGVTL